MSSLKIDRLFLFVVLQLAEVGDNGCNQTQQLEALTRDQDDCDMVSLPLVAVDKTLSDSKFAFTKPIEGTQSHGLRQVSKII